MIQTKVKVDAEPASQVQMPVRSEIQGGSLVYRVTVGAESQATVAHRQFLRIVYLPNRSTNERLP